jgi:hypothetical protein
MSEVGLPSAGAFHCSFSLATSSKFGFGGGGGPTASAASGDFLLLLGRCRILVSVPPWAWGAEAAGAGVNVPAVPRGPPTGGPTGEPTVATCVFAVVVTALTPFPTWLLAGRPSDMFHGLVPPGRPMVESPLNALGRAQVGSGCSLDRGGRSKLTTGPHPTDIAGTVVGARCRHGNDNPSGSATHWSRASAHITLPQLSRRTSAGIDVMPNLAINSDVRAVITVSSDA